MKKLFTLLVVIYPILSVYATPISKLSVADLLMSILFPFFLFNFFKVKNKITSTFILVGSFIYYILITLFLQIAIDTDVGILSTLRYALYLFCLILSFRYFDSKLGIKLLQVITLSMSVYVIFQFTTYIVFSITLPWSIPGFEVIDENFVLLKQSEYYLTYYRPTGVFLEPTHFAQYCVVYLIYMLFHNIRNKINLLKALVVTSAIVASGSSLGLIFIVFIWTIWFIRRQMHRFSPLILVCTALLLIIIVESLSNIDYFQNYITRLITDNGINGAAVGYRFNSVSVFFDKEIPIINWLIGFGRSSEDVYYTGIFYFLNANGIIGLLLFILICINAALRGNDFGKWLAITVLMLSIGSEFVCNFGILYYFAFIYSDLKTNITKETAGLKNYHIKHQLKYINDGS